MGISTKNIATFLLGAAAGAAVLKYASMTDEEKDQLIRSLKSKAGKFREEAETGAGMAKDYFSELGREGAESLKEHWSDIEKYLRDLLGKKSSGEPTTSV